MTDRVLIRLQPADANDVVVTVLDDGRLHFGDDLSDKYADFSLTREDAQRLLDALAAYLRGCGATPRADEAKERV